MLADTFHSIEFGSGGGGVEVFGQPDGMEDVASEVRRRFGVPGSRCGAIPAAPELTGALEELERVQALLIEQLGRAAEVRAGELEARARLVRAADGMRL